MTNKQTANMNYEKNTGIENDEQTSNKNDEQTNSKIKCRKH